uniref:SEC-C metal-binding domain-containing protein n=1 Tax=Paraglaciecola arctica TaxID=1128911 RepID=UPI0009DA147A|nr:SEC-C metal-binding domain-containing protein [Paraglaciecola arctica]
MTKNNQMPASESEINQASCCSRSSCCAPPNPVVRVEPKVGRNDPCPCGNGRKFKKCCGKNR